VIHKNKVLVTGGAGYIGSHTAVELIENGYEVVLIDNFSKSDRTLLDGMKKILGREPEFFEGDCLDVSFMRRLFSEHSFDCVLHFAAYKSVGESVSQPLMYYKNNVNALVVLLEVMKEKGVRNLIFSSSCTVYGQPDQIPVDESAPFKTAQSPYGATKQMCERIIADVYKTGFKVVSLRYFNPIGAHPSTLMGELPIEVPNNLVPYITQTAIGKRAKLTIFGNDYDTPDGSNIRDFVHVMDVASAHVKAMEFLKNAKENTFYEAMNLGTGVGVSVLQLVEEFQKAAGVKLPYHIGPRRAGDVEKVYANPTKANSMLGWMTKYTLSEALLHAWKWEQKINQK
jgi:UDP-glucose 4-epimerase